MRRFRPDRHSISQEWLKPNINHSISTLIYIEIKCLGSIVSLRFYCFVPSFGRNSPIDRRRNVNSNNHSSEDSSKYIRSTSNMFRWSLFAVRLNFSIIAPFPTRHAVTSHNNYSEIIMFPHFPSLCLCLFVCCLFVCCLLLSPFRFVD